MDYQTHILVEAERRKDMIRHAKNRRINKHLTAIKSEQESAYHIVLLKLGRSLTAWGLQMQAKHSAIVEIPSGYIQTGQLAQKTLITETYKRTTTTAGC